MINLIINGFLSTAGFIMETAMQPVDLLISSFLPNLNNFIDFVFNFITIEIPQFSGYFLSIFPPTFKALLLVWFNFVLTYYTAYYTYLTFIYFWKILQRLKFW